MVQMAYGDMCIALYYNGVDKMTWECDPFVGDWDAGRVIVHCRGGEDACLRVTIVSIKTSNPRSVNLHVDPSWKSAFDVTINDNDNYNVNGDGDVLWNIGVSATSSTGTTTVLICYDDENGATPPPSPTKCGDYENQEMCEYQGCKWVNGVCQSDGAPSPTPGDSTELGIDREVSLYGHKFKLSAANCRNGEFIVEAVGTGIKRVLVLGAAFQTFRLTSVVVYMTAVWVNDQCDEIAVRAIAAPIDPEEKGPDTNSGQTIEEMDEKKYDMLEVILDQEDLAAIDMEELKHRDVVAHSIVADEPVNDGSFTDKQWNTMLEYYDELLDRVASEDITVEEFWKLWDDYVIGQVAVSFVGDSFTIKAPSLVMVDDEFVVSGITPMRNMHIQIMAVKKFWGFDSLATDTVLTETTSDEFFKYETKLSFDEMGGVSLYARAPKDWFDYIEFWKDDYDTEKTSVYVLSWTLVIALLIVIGLILEKKYNKLGLFKRR